MDDQKLLRLHSRLRDQLFAYFSGIAEREGGSFPQESIEPVMPGRLPGHSHGEDQGDFRRKIMSETAEEVRRLHVIMKDVRFDFSDGANQGKPGEGRDFFAFSEDVGMLAVGQEAFVKDVVVDEIAQVNFKTALVDVLNKVTDVTLSASLMQVGEDHEDLDARVCFLHEKPAKFRADNKKPGLCPERHI
jgi:hypothetical protein